MDSKRDLYEILEVDQNASDGEIKTAYRKKAMQFHPDRNPDDQEAERLFKEAAEAYEILRNAETRRQYDQYGHAGLRGANIRGFSGFDDIFSAFSDIFGGGSFFEDLFGMGSRGPRKGPSLKCRLDIDFREMCRGTEKVIEIKKHERCETCQGSGAQAGTQPVECETCRGSGQVVQSQGFFSLRTTCPRCHGEGSIVEKPCTTCKGTGRTKTAKELTIPIPGGIDHGQTLVLRGEGEPGPPGAVPGDLHCIINVTGHPFFQRQGADLICEAPVPYSTLVLGGDVEVPTLDGKISMKIPRGTQSGQTLRLKSLGVHYDRGKGDQWVRVYVDVPKKTTKRQTEILRELAEIEDQNVTPERKSFFKKLKDLFSE